MIHFITTAEHAYTLKGIRKSPYRTFDVTGRSYDWLFRQSTISTGACVFTDLDRLRYFELAEAATVCRRLREAGVRVFNDPARVLLRYDLLSRLRALGINDYRVYPAAQRPRPERFPVFLKCEEGHSQHFFDVLEDQSALDACLDKLRDEGVPLTRVLVTEFANTPLRDGVYRRHTIYRVGSAMLPGNTVLEDSPFVKYGRRGLATDAEFEEIIAEMAANPHAELLRPAFEAAGVDYGRADFGFRDGRLAVYEINTNPSIGLKAGARHADFNAAVDRGMRAFIEALGGVAGPRIRARIAPSRWHAARLRPVFGLRLPQP
ncbi:hypothetical protein [Stappia stellulata]|uniref:hypothetical protein n=1 Tax=Stappia stellulata TaxID=71235 RepID=UPI000685409C|nr:hypothetical protein [Stappia stellulata]